MKNRMVWKLAACFGAALLLFSIVTGTVFIVLFRQHTIDLRKGDMERRAMGIARTYSAYRGGAWPTGMMGMGGHGHGSGHNGLVNYLRILDDISLADVWIVDEDMALVSRGACYAYSDLPENAGSLVERVLQGETAFSEDFSDLLQAPTLTVGAPVFDSAGNVAGAVLLHSPVEGIEASVAQGLSILAVSILVAMVLAAFLSVGLSCGFAKPLEKLEAAAQRLADGDYSIRTGVVQKDEIGRLARMIDLLAVRLRDASQEGERMEQMRRDFITNVSHELRTPVTVLRGSLEALRDGVVTDPGQVAQYQDQMLAESLYLERLVNDLLELSRLQNPDFPIEMAPLNVCDVISDVARGMRRVAASKEVTVQAELPVAESWVMGDYGRIRQMLMIVLDNAIKFSGQGQSVQVWLRAGEESVVFGVSDTGSGIAPEELPYIFDRFRKDTSEKNRSGSGLGLAIARRIAQRHGAEITVTSAYGKGTEFTFHFRRIGPPEREGETLQNEKSVCV